MYVYIDNPDQAEMKIKVKFDILAPRIRSLSISTVNLRFSTYLAVLKMHVRV